MKTTLQLVVGITLFVAAVLIIVHELSRQKVLKPTANVAYQYYVKRHVNNIKWRFIIAIGALILSALINYFLR